MKKKALKLRIYYENSTNPFHILKTSTAASSGKKGIRPSERMSTSNYKSIPDPKIIGTENLQILFKFWKLLNHRRLLNGLVSNDGGGLEWRRQPLLVREALDQVREWVPAMGLLLQQHGSFLCMLTTIALAYCTNVGPRIPGPFCGMVQFSCVFSCMKNSPSPESKYWLVGCKCRHYDWSRPAIHHFGTTRKFRIQPP